jgi:hypothetical protein
MENQAGQDGGTDRRRPAQDRTIVASKTQQSTHLGLDLELWSPGDGSTQAVALTFAPSGMDVGSGVFVNLYQNGAMIASGKGKDAISGVLTLQFVANTPGPVEVQIDNQSNGASISYTVSQSQVVIVKEESSGGDEEGGDEE